MVTLVQLLNKADQAAAAADAAGNDPKKAAGDALFAGRALTRNVAIGTTIAAVVALAALVALAIFFPLLGLPFLIGGSIAAAAVLSLGITGAVYCDRAVQINEFLKEAQAKTSA